VSLLGALFGRGRKVIAETASIFAPNREAEAARAAGAQAAALKQYAAEFAPRVDRTWIDALADGLNRLVRPVVTLGLFAPVVLTLEDPERMARVWRALATMPAGYWAVVGIVLPFYFGGRMQVKNLEAGQFRAAAAAVARLGDGAAADADDNAALEDWRDSRGSGP